MLTRPLPPPKKSMTKESPVASTIGRSQGRARIHPKRPRRPPKRRPICIKAKRGQEGLVLTEAQLVALEKAKSEKEAHGEFESERPGVLRLPGNVLCRRSEGC